MPLSRTTETYLISLSDAMTLEYGSGAKAICPCAVRAPEDTEIITYSTH